MTFSYDFQKLDVYAEALDCAERIYIMSKDFPSNEAYGMTSQIRRSSLSIALNIAEGKGRFYTKVYVQFLYQARGSLYETMALMEMAKRLQYITAEAQLKMQTHFDQLASKLNSLINALNRGSRT